MYYTQFSSPVILTSSVVVVLQEPLFTYLFAHPLFYLVLLSLWQPLSLQWSYSQQAHSHSLFAFRLWCGVSTHAFIVACLCLSAYAFTMTATCMEYNICRFWRSTEVAGQSAYPPARSHLEKMGSSKEYWRRRVAMDGRRASMGLLRWGTIKMCLRYLYTREQ